LELNLWVIESLQTALRCGKYDPKFLETNEVGYLSTHIDFVRLTEGDPECAAFASTQFWVELQIRTQAQHLWSEMSHDTFYKNDETITVLPEDAKRRVHLMAGQIEIADREFDRLGKELPADQAAEIFRFLEPYYYRLTSKRPDPELSLEVLKAIGPLYGVDLPSIKMSLGAFLDDHRPVLEEVYSVAQSEDAASVSPLFFQPEALLLYERLDHDQVSLRRLWNEHFPEKALEGIANDFGISFD
jgi:hypothetical protein